MITFLLVLIAVALIFGSEAGLGLLLVCGVGFLLFCTLVLLVGNYGTASYVADGIVLACIALLWIIPEIRKYRNGGFKKYFKPSFSKKNILGGIALFAFLVLTIATVYVLSFTPLGGDYGDMSMLFYIALACLLVAWIAWVVWVIWVYAVKIKK